MDKFVKLLMLTNTLNVLWDRKDPINPFNVRSKKDRIVLKIFH